MFLTWIGLIWGSGFGVYKLFCKGYSLFWMRFRAGQGWAREGHRHRAHRAQGRAGQRRAAQGSAKGARGQGREGKGRAGKGRPEQRTGRVASWPQYSKKAPTPSPCPSPSLPPRFRETHTSLQDCTCRHNFSACSCWSAQLKWDLEAYTPGRTMQKVENCAHQG